MIDEYIIRLVNTVPQGTGGMILLLAITAAALFILSKGADLLVDQAVSLSLKWGVPKMLIGATIVSLGTTLPEVTVSVMSALNGSPGLAMGNAVGSIICDTGLILGIAALIKPLPFKKAVVNRQGWLQLAAGILLVITSFVAGGGIRSFTDGGTVPRFKHATVILLKLAAGAVLVIGSSKILIPVVQEIALRLHIPETIIAATLIAFGTFLPELITAVTAARKGHGDLAIGNIIGADILNVLFVIGASAAVLSIAVATVTRAPNYHINLILIGMVKIKWIAVACIAIALLTVGTHNIGGHIAHIGGIAAGIIFAIGCKYGWWHKQTRKRKAVILKPLHRQSVSEASAREEAEKELDKLLIKVKQSGYNSLSEKEKQKLSDLSKKI